MAKAGRPPKQTRISIKIDSGLYKDFQDFCGENFQTVAGAVKQLMKQAIEKDREHKRQVREHELKLATMEREQREA